MLLSKLFSWVWLFTFHCIIFRNIQKLTEHLFQLFPLFICVYWELHIYKKAACEDDTLLLDPENWRLISYYIKEKGEQGEKSSYFLLNIRQTRG